jgi:hypothetical protein
LQLKLNKMKYIFSVLLAAILIASCNGKNDTTYSKEDSIKHAQMLDASMDTTNVTEIQWLDSVEQKLGTVKEGEQVAVSWRFKNAGNKNLVIGNVTAGCGCTIPETPKEPIEPGKEGVIKAVFNSNNQSGSQHKTVMVMANTKPNNHSLTFSVDVVNK